MKDLSNMIIHFDNGQVFSLKVGPLKANDLKNIFNTKEVPGAYVIHDKDRTICVPCSRMVYIDFQPLPTDKPIELRDDEMPF